jgi:flagellum-specific ATP synthase
VLVDGDDFNEPIADAVRSILDGHVVLDRSLAHAGHYPAIDVLGSVSRLEGEVTSRDVRAAGRRVRALLAAHREKADLISIGAYQPGTDPLVDEALLKRGAIDDFLRQGPEEPSTAEEADAGLLALAGLAPPVADEVVSTAVEIVAPPARAGASALPPLHLSI